MAALIEIICVGNELLIGKTVNTNAHWLAKRTTTLGLRTRRITTVEDDVEEIATSIKEALKRKNRFIITVGGLGPTFDDKTLEGIAEALDRKLAINDDALNMVEKRYLRYVEEGRLEKAELTPPRIKMAKLPEGAKPLANPVGTAPGVLIDHEETTLIALPGVPAEMKAIFDDSVAPLFRQEAGELTYFEASLDVLGVMESDIAPLIDRVMRDNPHVYIKSHPKGMENIPRIELHFSTSAEDTETGRNRLAKAVMQISALIETKGGKVKPLKTEA